MPNSQNNINNCNKHITDFLLEYVISENRTDYAVLLSGGWGTGKTWYVKNILINALKQKELNIFSMSLYGMQSVDEIAGEYFRQNNKFWSSQSALTGRAIGKEFLKAYAKFDADKIEKVISKDLPQNKNFIMVLDDIERCGIEITELFGYLHYYVEEYNTKVILVANEEKIKDIWKNIII